MREKRAMQTTRFALITALLAAIFSISLQSAQAAGSIGTQTYIAPGASSSLPWSNAQASLDMSKIYASANPGQIYRSVDSGTTWSPVTALGYRQWSGVAVNDTATVIGAIALGDYLYLSTDSGATWNAVTTLGTGSWTDIDINASGTVIIISTSSTVRVSTDTGATWQSYSPGGSSNNGVAVSASGSKMAVLSYNGSGTALYLSSNSGATWTAQTNAGGSDYSSPHIWMSRDGNKLIFSKYSSYLMAYSQDFGGTWGTYVPPVNSRAYGSFAATDDLSRVWVSDPNGPGHYTSNSGSTWTYYSTYYIFKATLLSAQSTRLVGFSSGNNTGVWTSDTNPGALTSRTVYDGYSQWNRVVTSNDGQTIASAGEYGEISTSSDGGATWTYSTTPGRAYDWTCLSVSGDGNVIYAGFSGSALYRSLDKGVTWSSLSGGALTAGTKTILGCATNNDGSKIAVSIYTTGLLYSSNTGVTFSLKLAETINSVTYGFGAVTMSNDGSKIAVAARYGTTKPIFLTTDSGGTWAASTVITSTWSDLKSTSDGSILVAVPANTNAPSISSDWGSTWSSLPGIGTTFKYGISLNSDASVIVASQNLYNGDIYFSTNKGVSFTKFAGLATGYYPTTAINSDASKIYIALNNQRLASASLNISTKVSFASLTIPLKTAVYRNGIVITANIGTVGGDGKVTFYANGKKIPGCIKRQSSSLIATCTWKPSTRGAVTVRASIVPNDGALVTSYSDPVEFLVGNRIIRR